ncbi:MAG TPA: ABC transporter permease [Bryobacteraceae bacterium]|jgi:ABC-2 type transport system permease protein
MTAIAQTWFLTVRLFRQLMRQPWWIAISLAQPIIWLVLYGQLFKRVVDIPGFGQQSYITFLAPGVVIMSALYGAGWSGMGVIDELDRGVIDRFLVAPTSRAAIIGGRLLSGAISTTVQCLLLLVLGLVMGARYPGGLNGVIVMAVSAVLLGLPIGALSTALALTIRRRESVIGASNFLLLPMTFLSPVFMASSLMPDWIRSVSRYSPVTWSVEAARFALLNPEPEWSRIALRIGCLLIFCVLSWALAVRAFGSYQKSA